MYDYPLEPDWSTEEIIEVVGLYNAVEQAYEEGISSKEFMEHYRARDFDSCRASDFKKR